MYAFANHGWVTTVGTVLIGPWLLSLATHNGTDRTVLFRAGPFPLHADAYPSAVVTAAAVLQLFVLPMAGAAADGARSPRRLLVVACLGGSAIAALLATSSGGEWLYAGCLYLLGTLVFGASDVVYNSFLPRIAIPVRRDAVSSLGFAYGYAGAGLLLAVNLALVELHGSLGLSKAGAVRLSFVSAGLWWAGFGTFSLSKLRHEPATRPGRTRARERLVASVAALGSLPLIRRYLAAYLLFADAISAVIALSSTYITHQLFHDDAARASGFLFALVLAVQFVAVAGSLLFGRLAQWLGAKTAVLLGLGVWCLIITYAYAELHTKAEAVVLGVAIGTVLGGTQALARSLYSQLVPRGSEATFFGLFEVANQGTSWVAPLLFTVVVNATGSFRLAILSLLALFAGGGILLAATKLGRFGGAGLDTPRP
jgi:UMF1 family MFS transporter